MIQTRGNSFLLQLTILLGFNDILLSGNWDPFREIETMIGISNRGNIIQRSIMQTKAERTN